MDAGPFHVAPESGRAAHVVALPGAHLQDEVVGVGAGNEVGAKLVQHLLEGGARPALARHSSWRHHSCEYSHAVQTMPNASMPLVGGVV